MPQAAVFFAIFAFGFYRTGRGINFTDEGLYLAAPLRYALGGLPFRDEFLNPHRMFDVVLSPLHMLFPEISARSLRVFWLVVQNSAAIALWSVFARFAPGIIPALGCAATLYVSNLLWSPGYHLMGTFFFVLAWAIWLRGCSSATPRGSVALGAASGAVFALGTLSFVPLLALTVFPVCVLASELVRGSPSSARAKASLSQLGVLGLVAIFAGATYVALGVAYYAVRFDWIYGTVPLSMTTSEFAQPRLAEIRGTPQMVGQLDPAAEYLAGRVERGDL